VTTEETNRDSARLRAGGLALVGGTAICAGKFAVAGATGSTAVYSDALESIVNIAAAALLLFALVVAARPADRDHPYGHGKVEFFSAGVEGALIAMAAVLILFEAISELVRGPEIRRLDVAIVGSAILAAGNGLLGTYLVHTGRKNGSDALVADGRHVIADVVTTGGVIVGLGLVAWTGFAPLDPLMAIAVALWILRTGYSLLRSAVGGLMDEADESQLVPICTGLEAHRAPEWIDVHSLRSFRSGAVQHIDLHLAVPRYLDADRLHEIDDEVEAAVRAATDHVGGVIVHFDPCRPRMCSSCAVDPCPIRKEPFVRQEPIRVELARREDEVLESGAPLAAEGESR